MPGQYYVYLPFKPTSKGAAQLKAEVDKWALQIQTRVDEATRQVAGITKTLQDQIAFLEKYQVVELQKKITDCQALLNKLPRKRPILLSHGAAEADAKAADAGALSELSKVDPSMYTLYILGHCAPGSDSIFDCQGKAISSETLSATALVERMVDVDKLPKSVRFIKLLACYGGKADVANGYPAFYQNLSGALVAKGYANFKLTAYTEPLLISSFYQPKTPFKAIADIKLGEVIPKSPAVKGRAKDYRVEIDIKARNEQLARIIASMRYLDTLD
ncbi:hypothetical protein A7982_13773 [Minicystis rosea]|nr:hypothetical protein A7982_13773 [Minicystis rosea]